MRTKVAEFWKLPDSMEQATRVTLIRKVPDGEGAWRWSHLVRTDTDLVAVLLYDRVTA